MHVFLDFRVKTVRRREDSQYHGRGDAVRDGNFSDSFAGFQIFLVTIRLDRLISSWPPPSGQPICPLVSHLVSLSLSADELVRQGVREKFDPSETCDVDHPLFCGSLLQIVVNHDRNVLKASSSS